MSAKPVRSRRLLILFAAATVVPIASLVWVGWRAAAQDREQEVTRAEVTRREAREHAVDLAVSALHRTLAEAEEKLTEFNAAPGAPADLADGSALLAFGPGGVIGRSGTSLPWHPAVPVPVAAEKPALGDGLEFHDSNLPAALGVLDVAASNRDAAVRGEALLRQARIHGKMGQAARALAAYDQLATLDGSRTLSGLPAGLVARLGRATIFAAASRPENATSEAVALRTDLASGRWLLTRTEFDGALELTDTWAPRERPAIDAERAALAEVATGLWRDWRAGRLHMERGRELRRLGDVPVLVLTRSSEERLTVLLLAPRYLESEWSNGTRGGGPPRVDFALTDSDGPVLGRTGAPALAQSVRFPSQTRLPWTVHAIETAGPVPEPPLSGATRLLLTGVAMMILLLLAVAYFIHRTMIRELTVAQLQSDFVAAVSHEFRTPLTTMRQLSELLVRGRFSSEARRQEFYETLLRESGRLQKLVEGVLDFKRFETGGAGYWFEAIEAGSLVREVVSDFERQVTGRGFHLELTAPDDDTLVLADRDALTRAIWNLLDNAVKYSPDCRTIWVDVLRELDRVSITVRDRGLGIPAHQQQAVFDRFVRGEQSKSLGISGTGIGLAVVKTIVQAHGGEIRLASEPGQGSQFTMLLRTAEGVS